MNLLKTTLLVMSSAMILNAGTIFEGKILETKDSGGYTYVYVQGKDNKYWSAIPQREVKIGDSIALDKQMWVENFYSKTLDQKFDKILFAVVKKDKPKMAKIEFKKTKKDFISVGDVFKNSKSLDSKEIKVNGVVTKVSYGILGFSWVHIQDTTSYNSQNDLIFLIKTNDVVEGQRVDISGKVANNKDFGAGYKYDVIVEDAKII